MDIRVLKYFLQVAQDGNFTKAAEHLHITQPTLSRQIMDLENELGVKLFQRGKRQVTLTESGYIYHQKVQDIIRLVEQAEEEVKSQENELMGLVSIGCVETCVANYLMAIIEGFIGRYPKVRFEFYNGYSDDIKKRLDANQLDIGILIEPVEAAKYDYIALPVKEQWGVVLHHEDSLAMNEHVTLEEIIDKPMILPDRSIVKSEIESWMDVPSQKINVLATNNLMSNTLLLVEKQLGYMITVKGAFNLRPNALLRFIPLKPERQSGHVLAWKKNKPLNRVSALLVEAIKEAKV